jgi:hypothetical protein
MGRGAWELVADFGERTAAEALSTQGGSVFLSRQKDVLVLAQEIVLGYLIVPYIGTYDTVSTYRVNCRVAEHECAESHTMSVGPTAGRNEKKGGG